MHEKEITGSLWTKCPEVIIWNEEIQKVDSVIQWIQPGEIERVKVEISKGEGRLMSERFKMRNTVDETIGARTKEVRLVGDALGGPTKGNTSRLRIEEVPVDDIVPRAINKYKQSRISRLAKSIRNTNNRLIHPIVIMKGEDLDPTHDIYKKYVADGVNPSTIKYIIVSGERRYRAWLRLREEENQRHYGEIGYKNPFDTITANILTKKEAANEQAFFEDSNLETRQLTSLEAILHIQEAIDEVQTEEQKKDALTEMGFDSEKKKFNQAEYCKYYLENELGIENISIGTIKQDLGILNNCHPDVIDAIIEGKLSLGAGRDLYPLDVKDQLELLALYIAGKTDAYKAKIRKFKQNRKAPCTAKKYHCEVLKTIEDCSRKNKAKVEELKLKLAKCSAKDKEQVEEVLKILREAISKLEVCIKELE